MNHNKKIKKMKNFINAYGEITQEHFLPPDTYYKTGSYFANFHSKRFGLFCSVRDTDKYKVYKTIVDEINNYLKKENAKK